MEIKIPFGELSEYLTNHYVTSISIAGVSSKELYINVEALKGRINASFRIWIEEVRSDGLTLSYYVHSTNIPRLVSGVLVLLKKLFSDDMVACIVLEDDSRVSVDLRKLRNSKKALEQFALEDILVNKEGLTVLAHIK